MANMLDELDEKIMEERLMLLQSRLKLKKMQVFKF